MKATVTAALMTTVLATSCASDAPESDEPTAEATGASTFEISGRVLAPIDGAALLQEGLDAPNGRKFIPGRTPCLSAGNVGEGSQLVVGNAEGTTIGTVDLAAGVLDASGEQAPLSSPCTFEFAVTVPSNSDFYDLQVGGYSSTFSIDELDYPINLSLGR